MGAPTVYLPNEFKIVVGSPPVTTNGTVTHDSVSLKNVKMAWLILNYKQAATHATVLTPKVGATVATATNAITFSAQWWKNVDIATTDTLVKQTAAATMTCTTGVVDQQIVIQIDPAMVQAQDATYDCVGATSATSGEATNFVSSVWVLEMKYQAATPPAVITD